LEKDALFAEQAGDSRFTIVQTMGCPPSGESYHGLPYLAGDAGNGEPARPMPCQALDHASGYFLATGIAAAMYKRATEGGSYLVDMSLAGVVKYLRTPG